MFDMLFFVILQRSQQLPKSVQSSTVCPRPSFAVQTGLDVTVESAISMAQSSSATLLEMIVYGNNGDYDQSAAGYTDNADYATDYVGSSGTAPALDTSSYYNIPSVVFNVTFPAINPALYPGGQEALLVDMKAQISQSASVDVDYIYLAAYNATIAEPYPPSPPMPQSPPPPFSPPPRPPPAAGRHLLQGPHDSRHLLQAPARPLPPSPPPPHPPPPPPPATLTTAAKLLVIVWFPPGNEIGTGQTSLQSFVTTLQYPALVFPSFNTEGLTVEDIVVLGDDLDVSSAYVLSFDTSGFDSVYYNDYYNYEDDSIAHLTELERSNTPASVWVIGGAYVQILEYSSFFDDGVMAYDLVDGFVSVTSTTYRLCSIPSSMQEYLQESWTEYTNDEYSNVEIDVTQGVTQLKCRPETIRGVDSFKAGNLSEVSHW